MSLTERHKWNFLTRRNWNEFLIPIAQHDRIRILFNHTCGFNIDRRFNENINWIELSLKIDGEYCLEKGLRLIHLFLLVPCKHWSYIFSVRFKYTIPASMTLDWTLDYGKIMEFVAWNKEYNEIRATSMLVTDAGDNFKMLVTVLTISVTNILYVLTLALDTNIQKMSPRS